MKIIILFIFKLYRLEPETEQLNRMVADLNEYFRELDFNDAFPKRPSVNTLHQKKQAKLININKKEILPYQRDNNGEFGLYIQRLKQKNFCENSFLNTLNIHKTNVPNQFSEKSGTLTKNICSQLEQSCCDDSLMSNFQKKLEEFYEKYYSSIQDIKKILQIVKKIDIIVFHHIDRTKSQYQSKCFPKQKFKFIRTIKLLKNFPTQIIESYINNIQTKISNAIAFQCSICNPSDNIFYKMDTKKRKYIIQLSQQEINNFLIFSQKNYFYNHFQFFIEFMDCINNKSDTKILNFDFFYQILEEKKIYKDIIKQPSKFNNNQYFKNYLKNKHPLLENFLLKNISLAPQVTDYFKFKNGNQNKMVQQGIFFRSKKGLKHFLRDTIEINIEKNGYYNNNQIQQTNYQIEYHKKMMKTYYKNSLILKIIFILLIQFKLNKH